MVLLPNYIRSNAVTDARTCQRYAHTQKGSRRNLLSNFGRLQHRLQDSVMSETKRRDETRSPFCGTAVQDSGEGEWC